MSDKSKKPGLANLKPYAKGQCGNPKGRPKGSRTFSTVMAELLEMDAKGMLSEEELAEYKKSLAGRKLARVTLRDVICLGQIMKAVKTLDTQAFNAVADRSDGKPKQTVDNTHRVQTLEDLVAGSTGEEDGEDHGNP